MSCEKVSKESLYEMYVIETDLTKRPTDGSKTTVIILTAVLGSILVVGAFAMIYLLYRRINETGTSGVGSRPLGEPIHFSSKSDKSSRQSDQREHNNGWGTPFSKHNEIEKPKPSKPTFLRRELAPGGTRIRDERLSMGRPTANR